MCIFALTKINLMAEVIKMPRLSDTMEEGNVVAWNKKVGDKVVPGDILAEVETDKAVMEVESYFEGTLLYIGVESGPVAVNGILAVIGAPGEDFQAAINASGSAPAAVQTETAPVVDTEVAAAPTVPSESSDSSRVKASPLAKSIAAQAGISLTKVTGSGDQGRIVKRDVEQAMSGIPATAPTTSAALVNVSMPSQGDVDFPLSQMRKTIARRLSESMFTAPHFYLHTEINMGRAIASRKSISEDGRKVSFNDFVVKAAAMALRSHPVINSSWLGDKIRQNGNINVGVAVAVDEGLLVPVVKNADYKSMSQISEEVKSLAGKAKERKLSPEEMTGNTFTVSNLGMFDIEDFTAIINPPDACILAVGSIIEKPIVVNGQIVVGHMMRICLSCDHRVVDGASGAKFLQTFKSYLEEPVKMLV